MPRSSCLVVFEVYFMFCHIILNAYAACLTSHKLQIDEE